MPQTPNVTGRLRDIKVPRLSDEQLHTRAQIKCQVLLVSPLETLKKKLHHHGNIMSISLLGTHFKSDHWTEWLALDSKVEGPSPSATAMNRTLNRSGPGTEALSFGRPAWAASTLAGLLIFTIVVDVLGNLLVILSVYRNKKLRNAGNIFVVSLAIADLIVAIYPYPMVLTSIFHNGWNLGYLHCQISGFLMGLSVIGSIFNITGIAINRYCYICHSLKYDKLYSDKNSLCFVILIWALTFIAIVPNLFVESLQYDPRVYSCTFVQSVSSAYTVSVVFFHFILPISIVMFCYLRIWVLVIQVRRRVKPDMRPKLKPHDLRNFVTMFAVFVLFAVCWAPLNIIGLAVAVDPDTIAPRIPEWLFVASYFMAYFNSCLNAIIYGLLNQNFRREYKRIIISVCTAKIFFLESSNDAPDRIKSKPSPLMTNNNQVKVDSV